MNKVGYIVQNSKDAVLELGKYDKKMSPILLWRTHATLFKTYRDARNAIRRTQAYAKRHHFTYQIWFNQRIIALVDAEE